VEHWQVAVHTARLRLVAPARTPSVLHAVLADLLDEARRRLEVDGAQAERRLLRSAAHVTAYALLAADARFRLVRASVYSACEDKGPF